MRRRDFIGTSLAALAAGQAEAGPTGNIGYGTPYGPSGGLPGPTLDLNFLAGSLDSRITYTGGGGTYFNAAGALTPAVTNTPRFDFDPVTHAPRGLLIEESRTNSIRNSTMVGAVVGTPGSWPTNASSAANGVTLSIAALPIVNGIQCLDIQAAGTPTATTVDIYMCDSIAATNGVVYTSSMSTALVGGSLANVTSVMNQVILGGVSTAANTTATLSRTAVNFTGAGLSVWACSIRLNVTISQPINLTMRIGAPQFEAGAFATSFIPTSTVAATRAADVATMPLGAWFKAAAITVVVDGLSVILGGAGGGYLLCIDDGSYNNIINIFSNDGSYVLSAAEAVAGISAFIDYVCGTLTTGLPFKIGVVARAGFQMSNGTSGTPIAHAYAGQPSGLSIMRFGGSPGGSTVKSCYIRRVRYWPRALSAPELQAATL